MPQIKKTDIKIPLSPRAQASIKTQLELNKLYYAKFNTKHNKKVIEKEQNQQVDKENRAQSSNEIYIPIKHKQYIRKANRTVYTPAVIAHIKNELGDAKSVRLKQGSMNTKMWNTMCERIRMENPTDQQHTQTVAPAQPRKPLTMTLRAGNRK